ncbi:hypothetical protein V2J09_014295 [Rumex salicifolius]
MVGKQYVTYLLLLLGIVGFIISGGGSIFVGIGIGISGAANGFQLHAPLLDFGVYLVVKLIVIGRDRCFVGGGRLCFRGFRHG